MIPYYILAIEDETDRAYMTALFFQYQKLMYSTIQKVTNDHWLIDDIFQTSFEHLIGKIDLLKDLDRNRLVNYLIVTCRNTAYNMCRSYSAHITEDLDEYATMIGYLPMVILLSRHAPRPAAPVQCAGRRGHRWPGRFQSRRSGGPY